MTTAPGTATIDLPSDERERSRLLEALIRPLPRATYEVDYRLVDIEGGLQFVSEGASLDLSPDFQRGHVWTQEQQERWLEGVLRGAVASSGLLIQFNAPCWSHEPEGDLSGEVVCIDGLQRLTAARRFMAGEIHAFGLTADQYQGTSFCPRRMNIRLKFAIHEFQNRTDLLQYYLDVNDGGTPHSAAELSRVRKLLEDARQKAATSSKSQSSPGL